MPPFEVHSRATFHDHSPLGYMPPISTIYTFVSISSRFHYRLPNLLAAGQSYRQHGADQEHLQGACATSFLLPTFLSYFHSSPTALRPLPIQYHFILHGPRPVIRIERLRYYDNEDSRGFYGESSSKRIRRYHQGCPLDMKTT